MKYLLGVTLLVLSTITFFGYASQKEGKTVIFKYGLDVNKRLLEAYANHVRAEGCPVVLDYSEDHFPGTVEVFVDEESNDYENPGEAANWALKHCINLGK